MRTTRGSRASFSAADEDRAQKRFRIPKRVDSNVSVASTSNDPTPRASTAPTSSSSPLAATAVGMELGPLVDHRQLSKRLSETKTQWMECLRQAVKASRSGQAEAVARAMRAVMRRDSGVILSLMAQLGSDEAEIQRMKDEMDHLERAHGIAAATEPRATATTQLQQHPQLRQRQHVEEEERHRRDEELEHARARAQAYAQARVQAKAQAFAHAQATERARVAEEKLKAKMHAQAVARAEQQAEAVAQEERRLAEVEQNVAALHTQISAKESELAERCKQADASLHMADPEYGNLGTLAHNVLLSAGRHLAKEMAAQQISGAVLEWRMRKTSRSARVHRMLDEMQTVGKPAGSLIAAVTAANLSPMPPSAVAMPGASRADAVPAVEPCYQLFADIQIAMQSFCDFKVQGSFPQVWLIPQEVPSAELGQYRTAEVRKDPRLFKMFDRRGHLDTACRFYGTFASLPGPASGTSPLDVLRAMGLRLRKARRSSVSVPLVCSQRWL